MKKKINLANLAADEVKLNELTNIKGGSGSSCGSKGCGSNTTTMWNILHSNLLRNNS